MFRQCHFATFLVFSVCYLLLTTATTMAQEGVPKRPNLLVILVDDLGFADLSSYGSKDMRTPSIDSLAARGMSFKNFYANCPVCSPTRAALLSGRYPELVGIPGVVRTHAENNWGYLSADAVLLPQLLKAAGYHTALVGKWHLGLEKPNRPHDRGFDLFHGFLGDMMDDYYNHRRHGINYMRRGDTVIDPPGHATDLFSAWASDYLIEMSRSTVPFFLYLAYNAPHTPIQPPQEWVDKVLAREKGISPTRARLVAFIEHLDAGIGKVLNTLKKTGLEENTLVIFSSDNGGLLRVGANNGAYRDGKQSVYEGGIRVPTIAAWPGHIGAATTTQEVALTMDIFPTLLAAAGAQPAAGIDGRSFLPTLLGEKVDYPARDVFFTRREGGRAYGGKTIEAVIRGDWKLLQNSPYAPQELYNLRLDPREQNDLSQLHSVKMRELGAALREHIRRTGGVPWQGPRPANAVAR